MIEIEIDQRLSALRADSASASFGELDDSLIQALLNALAHFNANAIAQLGKGKSVGQGRLKWELHELKAISLEQLKTWAQAKTPKPLESYYQSIQDRFNPTPTPDINWKRIAFQLQAISPLLINNPEDELAKSEEKGTPNQVFLKRVGEQAVALIPASTLKGWCRAQGRRILLTLTQNTQVDRVEELLVQLFGSTDQVGVLRFYDATVSYAEDDIHEQTFNAVDRFTGGVKDGALYSVHALYPKTAFKGQVAYLSSLPAWMKWLLLLVWRDAEEGDLVLGSDKAKGYGQLCLRNFKQGAPHYFESNVEALKQGAYDLHQALNKTTHKASHHV
jgi:CRISPR/Cas system CSM-associated protein Csm3 (group 7 of RAMP superfamily)